MNDVRFRDVAAFVAAYWWRSRWLLTGAVAAILAATICDVFLPVAAGALIDSLGEVGIEVDGETRQEQGSPAFAPPASAAGVQAGQHPLTEPSSRLWVPHAPPALGSTR